MATGGRAKLKDILRMLEFCAPGSTYVIGMHYVRVMYRDLTYPTLPKGEHGKIGNLAEIEKGHIRKMIRFLKIDPECAKRYLPLLG